jgi:hypothetical protein
MWLFLDNFVLFTRNANLCVLSALHIDLLRLITSSTFSDVLVHEL